MRLYRVNSHEKLQSLAESISARYWAPDPFIFRSAVLEVLQNTLQHSDGRFVIEYGQRAFRIINLVKEHEHIGFGLGLKLYTGIKTKTKNKLFITEVKPEETQLMELDLEAII